MRLITHSFRTISLCSLFIASLIVGCKGSDPAPAAADLAGNYKLTAYTATDGKQSVDYLLVFTAFGNTCLQDLVINLKSDGGVSSNSPASCSAGSDIVDEFKGGKWAASGTTLSLTAANQPKEDWTYAVSGKKLSLTQTEVISGVSVSKKMELTKQ